MYYHLWQTRNVILLCTVQLCCTVTLVNCKFNHNLPLILRPILELSAISQAPLTTDVDPPLISASVNCYSQILKVRFSDLAKCISQIISDFILSRGDQPSPSRPSRLALSLLSLMLIPLLHLLPSFLAKREQQSHDNTARFIALDCPLPANLGIVQMIGGSSSVF